MLPFKSDFPTIQQNPFFGLEYYDHPIKYWWRVESTVIWKDHKADDFSFKRIPFPMVYFERWWVVGATEHTVLLNPYQSDPKWEQQKKLSKRVLKQARKRWAYPTKELAWKSWCIRQRFRLSHAKTALKAAQATNDLIAEFSDSCPFTQNKELNHENRN